VGARTRVIKNNFIFKGGRINELERDELKDARVRNWKDGGVNRNGTRLKLNFR